MGLRSWSVEGVGVGACLDVTLPHFHSNWYTVHRGAGAMDKEHLLLLVNCECAPAAGYVSGQDAFCHDLTENPQSLGLELTKQKILEGVLLFLFFTLFFPSSVVRLET